MKIKEYVYYQKKKKKKKKNKNSNNKNKKKDDTKLSKYLICTIIYKIIKVPADLLLLKTSNINGECFIRTDQLDGETDWKLRYAIIIS